jgi:riboflavin kinase/FMN adenylyltransferase
MAQEYNCGSALITFDPDPWVTIRDMDKSEVEHLTTMRQKINLAVAYGIENIYILKFTKEMSRLSPDDFVQWVLGQLNLKALVCGFDFRYGKNGEGRPDVLKYQVVYPVVIVDEVKEGGEKISSSRISTLIKEGRMEEAVYLLGHPFEVEGKVIQGRHLGTDLGFPTANIEIDPEYLIPMTGVYAALVKSGFDTYKAMVNIGHNPTLNYYKNISLEAHLFNFTGDLYGKPITVKLLKYIRPEIQFRTRENLIMQLELDSKAILNYLDQFPGTAI